MVVVLADPRTARLVVRRAALARVEINGYIGERNAVVVSALWADLVIGEEERNNHAGGSSGGQAMTKSTQQFIHDLRRTLITAATTCDEVLYNQHKDARRALQRLPGILEQLTVRADRVRMALESEDLT
jgi:hypothetical protein